MNTSVTMFGKLTHRYQALILAKQRPPGILLSQLYAKGVQLTPAEMELTIAVVIRIPMRAYDEKRYSFSVKRRK